VSDEVTDLNRQNGNPADGTVVSRHNSKEITMGSVKSQVTHSLNSLKAFGESRHQALADGTADDKIFAMVDH
jgi:hypothetical protein